MPKIAPDPELATMCELVGGGPADGTEKVIFNHVALVVFPLVVSDGPAGGPDRSPRHSERWVHAYIRLNEYEFAYDGIRER